MIIRYIWLVNLFKKSRTLNNFVMNVIKLHLSKTVTLLMFVVVIVVKLLINLSILLMIYIIKTIKINNINTILLIDLKNIMFC